jgi:hypothetical protein
MFNITWTEMFIGCGYVAICALYIRVEFLTGRLEKQTELIGMLSQAFQRLEKEMHGRNH